MVYPCEGCSSGVLGYLPCCFRSPQLVCACLLIEPLGGYVLDAELETRGLARGEAGQAVVFQRADTKVPQSTGGADKGEGPDNEGAPLYIRLGELRRVGLQSLEVVKDARGPVV